MRQDQEDTFSQRTYITEAEAIEASQVGFLADLGRAPQVELYDTPELLWFITGMPYPRMNRVLRAEIKSDAVDEKIEQVMNFFRARNVPFLWHLGPSTRPLDLGQHLLRHGEDEGVTPVKMLPLDS